MRRYRLRAHLCGQVTRGAKIDFRNRPLPADPSPGGYTVASWQLGLELPFFKRHFAFRSLS
jgi:hypothetical protein